MFSDIPEEVIHNKGQKYVPALQAWEVALQATNRPHNLTAAVHRKHDQSVQWVRLVARYTARVWYDCKKQWDSRVKDDE